MTVDAGHSADLNGGNVLTVDLESDGASDISVHLDEDRPAQDFGPVVIGLVGCDSGALFIRPGEQIIAGGPEPVESLSGFGLMGRNCRNLRISLLLSCCGAA